MNIGDKVRAKIDLISDLREDGMGIQLCAAASEELIIRGKSPYTENRFYVSHKNITDSSFCADIDELELITP